MGLINKLLQVRRAKQVIKYVEKVYPELHTSFKGWRKEFDEGDFEDYLKYEQEVVAKTMKEDEGLMLFMHKHNLMTD